MQIQTFASFLETHHRLSAEQLIADWQGVAFLLVAPSGQKPFIATLEMDDDEEDFCTNVLPGIEAEQFVVKFHAGFRGWVLNALSETLVDERPVGFGRPLLLETGSQIRSARNPSTRVQFYTVSGLVQRLRKAGATRRLPRTRAVTSSRAVPSSPDRTSSAPSVSQRFVSSNARGMTFPGASMAS